MDWCCLDLLGARVKKHLILSYSFFFIFIGISTIYSTNLKAQSTPSTSGFSCNGLAQGVFIQAFSDTLQSACVSVCSSFSSTFGLPLNYNGGRCAKSNGSNFVSLATGSAAICLTGSGYIAADNGGFCPDPLNDDSSGDDDDGDGNDCDSGEESGLDCNDGDSDDLDSDGDGVPDSQDNDDGICSEFNQGDLDCNSECKSGALFFQDFQYPDGLDFIIPPETLCDNTCQLDKNNNGDPPTGFGGCFDLFNRVSNVQVGLTCQYSYNGNSCSTCTLPHCISSDSPCPDGQSDFDSQGTCSDIPNFCDVDYHTNGTTDNSPDGKADNIDSFACSESSETCDPSVDPECSSRSVGQYQCDSPQPRCTGDSLECAIREESFRQTCGTQVQGDPFDCESTFVCNGDFYECTQIRFENEKTCQFHLTDVQSSDPDSLDVFREGVDDGRSFLGPEGDGNIISYASLSADLDDTGYGFSRQCITDQVITVNNKQVTLEWSRICPYFDVIAIILMLIAGYISLRIIGSAF